MGLNKTKFRSKSGLYVRFRNFNEDGKRWARVVREWLDNPPQLDDMSQVKERTTDKGRKIYYMDWASIDGYIVGAAYRETEKFKSRQIHLVLDDPDSGERYTVVMNAEFGRARNFFATLPNIDLDKPVLFTPYNFKNDEGKIFSGVSIKQEGEKVPKYYTKDEPHGKPDWEKKKVGNSIKWDSTDELAFYIDKFEEWIEENNLSTDTIPDETPQVENDEDNEQSDNNEEATAATTGKGVDEDDLPF